MPIFFDMVKCELELKGLPNEVTRISMLSKVVVVYLTNRFHVAVRLFSNRSQRTSKCGKNISATFLFFGNMESFCFIKLKYTEKMPFYFKFRYFDRHENSTDVI